MKKKTILITALAAVLVIGGVAVSSNPDMLQGRFTNMTRGGGFQAPTTESMDVKSYTGATSSSSSESSSGGLDVEDLSSVISSMEGYLVEVENYYDEAVDSLSNMEGLVAESFGMGTDDLEDAYSEVVDSTSMVESRYNAAVRGQEYIYDETLSSGALSASYRSQADDLVSEMETIKDEAIDLRLEALAIKNDYSDTEGDLEIADVTAFASSTELVLNFDVTNNPNSINPSDTRDVIAGSIVASGAMSSGKELMTFSASTYSKNAISAGSTESFTLYLDDDEANSWLINRVLAGEAVTVDFVIEVDTSDKVAESDETNNRYTSSLSL